MIQLTKELINYNIKLKYNYLYYLIANNNMHHQSMNILQQTPELANINY